MTQAERQAVIDELEQRNRTAFAQHQAKVEAYLQFQRDMNQAMEVYVAAVTAPIRAFAEQLRAEMKR